MTIKENGVLFQCPICKSTNVIVVEINMRGEIRKCLDCGEVIEQVDFEGIIY